MAALTKRFTHLYLPMSERTLNNLLNGTRGETLILGIDRIWGDVPRTANEKAFLNL